jgi:hypothetical protein
VRINNHSIRYVENWRFTIEVAEVLGGARQHQILQINSRGNYFWKIDDCIHHTPRIETKLNKFPRSMSFGGEVLGGARQHQILQINSRGNYFKKIDDCIHHTSRIETKLNKFRAQCRPEATYRLLITWRMECFASGRQERAAGRLAWHEWRICMNIQTGIIAWGNIHIPLHHICHALITWRIKPFRTARTCGRQACREKKCQIVAWLHEQWILGDGNHVHSHQPCTGKKKSDRFRVLESVLC